MKKVTLNIILLAQILNGAATIVFGLIVLLYVSRGRFYKHTFYYTWSAAFIIYGGQILFRVYIDYFPFIVFSMISALILFFVGIWSISRKKGFLYITSSFLLIVVFVTASLLAGFIPVELSYGLGQIVYYLPIIIAILYQRVLFGKSVDKLALGWVLLLVSNISLWGAWTDDIFSLFSKFLIFLGMMDQDFIITIEKVRDELQSPIPNAHFGEEEEGGLKLIRSSSVSKLKNLEFVNKKIKENLNNDLDTYLFSFQDTIPYSELRRIKWIKPEKIKVFLFSTSVEKMKGEFTVLPMDLIHIGATLSEVIKKDKRSSVFFMNLSLLIHVFGVYPVYNMLLDKMGALREEGVNLFTFFYPETHSDGSVISLFENISDEIIEA